MNADFAQRCPFFGTCLLWWGLLSARLRIKLRGCRSDSLIMVKKIFFAEQLHEK